MTVNSRILVWSLIFSLWSVMTSISVYAQPPEDKEGDGWFGAFNDESGFEDDWYFDFYDTDEIHNEGNTKWLIEREYYSGVWNDDRIYDDDWFYDRYEGPDDSSIFSIE